MLHKVKTDRASFRPRKVIAVDVDGTLHQNGVPCYQAIARLRELSADGWEMFLWSARGAAYAQAVAVELGIADLFTHFATKPGYILDDQGWSWIKFTKRLQV